MRVGLFGGSFDPVHRGHVTGAGAALTALALDRVVFLPTALPPHKPGQSFAPAWRRYAMTELALLDEPRLEVSPLEIAERPAFTVETLERWRSERPEDDPVLLVGADSLAGFDGWRRWRDILATTEIGVLRRPGFDWNRVEPQLPDELRRALAAARIGWVEAVEHPASASEIRRRLRAGEPLPDDWLEPRVLTFIQKYTLYR